MKKPQAGFTLIELVIVIVILGILAASALPRFSDLAGDARAAAINGLAGSLRSASAIAHATQLARNGSHGQSITLDGISINMSNGYPASGTATGPILSALTDYTGFTVTSSATSTSFQLRENCVVEYVAASSSILAASVSVRTTGCANN